MWGLFVTCGMKSVKIIGADFRAIHSFNCFVIGNSWDSLKSIIHETGPWEISYLCGLTFMKSAGCLACAKINICCLARKCILHQVGALLGGEGLEVWPGPRNRAEYNPFCRVCDLPLAYFPRHCIPVELLCPICSHLQQRKERTAVGSLRTLNTVFSGV